MTVAQRGAVMIITRVRNAQANISRATHSLRGRRSEIRVIGQQYFNHKISFRFYIISQESLTFHPSQNLPKTDHAFTAFIRGIPGSSPMRFFSYFQDVGEKMITKLSKFKLIMTINPETLRYAALKRSYKQQAFY